MAELFPGQVQRIDFNIAQAECLTSYARSEIFWAFSSTEPMSIAEVASGLGRSANATTYHVNTLASVGLLIAVGERRKRARLEKLYVRAAHSFFSLGSTAPPDYREHTVNSFQAFTRAMAREKAMVNKAFDIDPTLSDFTTFRRFTVRISRERAQEFKETVVQAFREFALKEGEEGDTSVSLVIYMSPTIPQSRRFIAEGGGVVEESPDSDPE